MSVKLRNPNFWIFQKWSQMTSKCPRNPNLPNRWPGNCCYYGIKSIICKKSKKYCQMCQNDNFEAKIKHFPAILSQKDQTLYHFQPYDLVQKSPSQTCRGSTGLVAMRHLKKKNNRKRLPKWWAFLRHTWITIPLGPTFCQQSVSKPLIVTTSP